jgi:hypothetical protein
VSTPLVILLGISDVALPARRRKGSESGSVSCSHDYLNFRPTATLASYSVAVRQIKLLSPRTLLLVGSPTEYVL